MWENHLFWELTLINVSEFLSAWFAPLWCVKRWPEKSVWLSVIMSGSTSWFPQHTWQEELHSGHTHAPVLGASQRTTGPSFPGPTRPGDSLRFWLSRLKWDPENSCSKKPCRILIGQAWKTLTSSVQESALREKSGNVVHPILWTPGISHEYYKVL